MTSPQNRRIRYLEEQVEQREFSNLHKNEPTDRHLGRWIHWTVHRDDLGISDNPALAQSLRKLLGLPKGRTLPGYNNAPKQAFYDEAARLIRLKVQQSEHERHV
jgi:hypothetical protein